MGQLYILLALALILFFGQFTEAKLCARIFTAPTLSSVKIENSLHHKLETSPNPKGNILLIHGLGDSLVQLNQLAKKFRSEGYTVLRVDLHGHGKNLERDVLEKRPIPSIIDYKKNVQDISSLVRTLKFETPIIIGHSYGGAIAHALMSALQGKYQAQKLIMLAPYLRRLDHPYLTGNPFIDAQTEYAGEVAMRENYKRHFEAEKRPYIEAQVETAIATTKGIRKFDVLSYGQPSSPKSQAPLLVVGGSKDSLITDDYLRSFQKKLEKENYPHHMIFIEGDHFFPTKNASDTAQVIIDFLQRD